MAQEISSGAARSAATPTLVVASSAAAATPVAGATSGALTESAPASDSAGAARTLLPAEPEFQTYLDLAGHPEHAQLRRLPGPVVPGADAGPPLPEQGALVIDMGEPGQSRYTLGGWRTGWAGTMRLQGATVAFSRGRRANLFVPLDADAPQGVRLWLRLLSPARGRLRAYWDGEAIGHVKPSESGLSVVHLDVPAEGATRGEHRLELKAPGVGRLRMDLEPPGDVPLSRRERRALVRRSSRSAGLALDWVAVVPRGAPEDEEEFSLPPVVEPPAVSNLRMALAAIPKGKTTAGARRGAVAKLHLPEGWSLAYLLRVPEAARLRATLARLEERAGDAAGVAGRQGPAVRIRLVDERGQVHPLPLSPVGRVTREGVAGSADRGSVPLPLDALDVDLSRWQGQVVRLDLSAPGGAWLDSARVEVPLKASQPADGRARNVLVYLVDTLRADHLKVYNPATRVRTPGLDLFARGAAVMTGAHTQENWTKPSVATLFSGLMPWEHHATTTEAVVPRSVRLMPRILRDFGYYTGAFIANGYVSGRFGFKTGWDTYRNYIREGRRTRSRFLAADVLDWLDGRVDQKLPFFLYVHSIDPHVPYRPTKQFMPLYDPLPYNGPVDFSKDSGLLERIKSGSLKVRDRDRDHLEALYDSEISYHDLYFQRIIAGLEERGLEDDTIVIVTADHGEEFWDHGSVGHGHNVYEELLHIPMLVRWPGVTDGGVRVDDAVGLVDVLPTLLEAIGEEIPEGITGRSFLPQLRREGSSMPRVSVSGFMDGWRTVVDGSLKLIHRTHRHAAVHDLRTDPGEKHDISAERPLTLRYLRARLGMEMGRSNGQRRAVRGKKGSRPRHRAVNTTIDAETEAQLEALGYVGSSRR